MSNEDLPDTPRDRPLPPPKKAIAGVGYGVVVNCLFAPLVVLFDILYARYNEGWLGVFMPDGLPVGPFIMAIPFSLIGIFFVSPMYQTCRLKRVRQFRIFAKLSCVFYLLVVIANVAFAFLVPAYDDKVFYGISAASLSLGAPFSFNLWRTIQKYRWFDPDSRPSEWEFEQRVEQT